MFCHYHKKQNCGGNSNLKMCHSHEILSQLYTRLLSCFVYLYMCSKLRGFIEVNVFIN